MKVKIQDIASLSNGINFEKSAYTSSGVKLIGVSDFKDRMFPDFDTLQEVKAEVVKERDYLRKGDIVFVRSNGNKELVGRCMMINKNTPVTFSGFCIKLRLNDLISCNPRYFTYLFKSNGFRKAIAGTAVGANIQNLSQGRLGNYEFELPPRSVQDSIATTLSRYDALIANYQRQIKLLEEAAQRLYKEWFVDLRFPGHESVKVTDGVPEGWRSYNIDDVFDIKYGKNLSTKEISSTGKYPVYGANGIIGYYNKYNCEEPVVLITSRGNGSGDVLKTYEQYTFVTNNSFVVKPKAQYSYCTLPFTFGLMCSANFRSVRTGAAQPQLTNASIHHINIVMPPCDIIKKYCSMMEADYKLVRYLRKQLTLLTESRDRLLPKLMSGEIEL